MKDLIEKWREQAKYWSRSSEIVLKLDRNLSEQYRARADVYFICASELEQKLKQMEDEK